MSALSLLKLILCIQILIGISYWIFCLALRISSSTPRPCSEWVRLGQVLILVSLLAPLAFQTIPMPRVPLFDWRSYHPAPEVILKKSHSKNAVVRQYNMAPPNQIAGKNLPSGFWERVMARAQSSLLLLLLLIFSGNLIYLFKFIQSIRRVRDLLEKSISVRKIGSVRIAVSDTTQIPFSVNYLGRSWVIIPSYLLKRTRDFRIASRHEIQHHRSRDTLWAWVIEWLICFFYFNPVIFYWKEKITEYQEFSCDETLLGRRRVDSHEYGSCLVRVAETALGVRTQLAGTAGMASNSRNPVYVKSFLRRRIEMLSRSNDNGLSQERCLQNVAKRFWVSALIGTVCVGVTMAVGFAAEQTLRSDPEKAHKINSGVLQVDPEIQQITDQVLTHAIEIERAKAGFVIVEDPNTGRILAVSNFDTTRKREGHWALSQRLEQASFFKGIVAAQALDEGLTSPQEKHSCENGSYNYHDRTYHDWKREGWDQLTTEETITNSSDICAMKIGERIGPDGLYMMLENFGFGPEGVAKQLPEARTGDLPPTNDRPSLVPFVTSGFGFKSTPLEILQAYGAIANGGNLMMPHGANDLSAEVIRRVLSPEASQQAREILRQVVLKGTGKQAKSDLVTTAGKTATAYTADYFEWMNGHPGDFAGFVGFAPVTHPQVAVYVGVLDPQSKDGQHAHGGEHAAPVFKELVERILKR